MYLEPTQENGLAFLSRGLDGPVVMLNLLRFRDTADYSANPELAPSEPISGKAAYDRYIEHTLPFLEEAGGELVFSGHGGTPLIGPTVERWDLVLLVRHGSTEAFMGFAQNKGYLAGIGHRSAALADSRLVPIAEGMP